MLFDNFFFEVKYIFTQLAREAQLVYLNLMSFLNYNLAREAHPSILPLSFCIR